MKLFIIPLLLLSLTGNAQVITRSKVACKHIYVAVEREYIPLKDTVFYMGKPLVCVKCFKQTMQHEERGLVYEIDTIYRPTFPVYRKPANWDSLVKSPGEKVKKSLPPDKTNAPDVSRSAAKFE